MSIETISHIIGASAVDFVNHVVDGKHIMVVDDIGHKKGLPINVEATKLYHARCRPGANPPPIVGDVVVVPMHDFGDEP